MRFCAILLLIAFAKAQSSEFTVLFTLDGLRADFVNEHNTPVLWKLAEEGVYAPHGIQSQVQQCNKYTKNAKLCSLDLDGHNGQFRLNRYWPIPGGSRYHRQYDLRPDLERVLRLLRLFEA